MNELPEHVGKQQLEAIGVPVPSGRVVTSAHPATVETPAVVKAQVPVSGRGKKGGIARTETVSATLDSIASMLETRIDGHPVETVLVEEVIDADAELYLGLAADGSGELPTFILSHRGGQDIEDVSEEYVATVAVNPLVGLQPYHLRTAARDLVSADGDAATIPVETLTPLLAPLWSLFVDSDLRVLEINPLGVVDREVVAMDAKLVVDEAASFRQDFTEVHTSLTDLEREARTGGIELKEADGRVAIMANGAGMGLSTLDLLTEMTGEGLASFIDTHGPQFSVGQTRDCLDLMARSGADVVVVNMVTAFLDARDVAEELVRAVTDGYERPIVARFKGLGAEEAIATCDGAGIPTAREVIEAVNLVGDLLEEVE